MTEEIADIAIYVVMLSNDMGIDLHRAVAEKLESNSDRYPVQKYKGSARKAPH